MGAAGAGVCCAAMDGAQWQCFDFGSLFRALLVDGGALSCCSGGGVVSRNKSCTEEEAYVPPILVRPLIVPSCCANHRFVCHNIYQLRLGAQLAEEGVTQWTGPATILHFFSALRPISVTFCLILLLKMRSPLTIGLAVTNLAILGNGAFVLLRRSEMIALGISVLSALWFARRVKIPAVFMAAGVLGMALVTFGINELRSASSEVEKTTGSAPSLFSFELWRAIDMQRVHESIELAPDFVNASFLIGNVSRSEEYRLGAVLWNGFVLRLVPAQLIGEEFNARSSSATFLAEHMKRYREPTIVLILWGGPLRQASELLILISAFCGRYFF